jgi:hypothetical protein
LFYQATWTNLNPTAVSVRLDQHIVSDTDAFFNEYAGKITAELCTWAYLAVLPQMAEVAEFAARNRQTGAPDIFQPSDHSATFFNADKTLFGPARDRTVQFRG